jgi:two-component system, chemotaxis family, protein-glutamate methylesterase/glutaminase
VFSIESLSSAQAEALEGALWAAVRSLEDRATLLMRLADRASRTDHVRSAETFERQAEEALERAQTVREAIERSVDDPAVTTDS